MTFTSRIFQFCHDLFSLPHGNVSSFQPRAHCSLERGQHTRCVPWVPFQPDIVTPGRVRQRDEGVAIVVFSHPCFPQGTATVSSDENGVDYHWNFRYFDRQKRVDPPWAHFTSEFIWFHRSLSDYWKAFKSAGFNVLDFEEPRLTEDRYHLAQNKRKLTNSKSRPYSVAFKLQKKRIA